ncbi:hypothetical protein ACIBBD_06065 [Streptomyces sp. NPDC051315]|uniref:hypothetical protein n=1 Tax=Streptomyces sp. NPDC051315 TaxID=3365650 RepID=UPI0037A0174D
MHRTTTTATLLLTVAASALAGCVTIQYPPAPGPPPAPSRPSAPPPRREAVRETEQRVVQAPALEALEMVGKDRGPAPTAPPRPRRTSPAAPAEQPPPARLHPKKPHPRPARPEPRHPAHPHAQVPDVRGKVREHMRENAGVCALGRQHGGWRADSPEAVICEQTYGR